MKKKAFAITLVIAVLLTFVLTTFTASAAPQSLTDYESISDLTGVINGTAPNPCRLSYALVTEGALNGNKSLSFTIDTSDDTVGDIYFAAVGGVGQFIGYDYFSVRLKNTDTANDLGMMLVIHGGDNNLCFFTDIANDILLRDTNNAEVIADFIDDTTLIIPAGFDGTVYFPIVDDPFVPEMRMKLTEVDGEYDGNLLWDDPTLCNTADVPAAGAPNTSAPSVSAPPASSTDGPADVGNTGSSLMLVPAIAAAAAAVVALRKRKA